MIFSRRLGVTVYYKNSNKLHICTESVVSDTGLLSLNIAQQTFNI